MLRSMFSAISGLRGHQVMMDVIANNIANVNTVGFKTGRVNFQDILSQTMRGATAPTATLGGIDPAQVGLGVTVAGIDVIHTQGNLQSTGKITDMAVQGDGFFMLADGRTTLYTRDGAFDISLDGSLVNPASGFKVLGWNADANGNLDTTAATTSLTIPIGRRTTAQATSTMAVRGNLDAGAAVGDTSATTLTVFDSLGVQHSCILTYTKTATNEWSWSAAMGAGDTATTASTGTISFGSDGLYTGSTGTLSIAFVNGATTPIDLDTAATPATLDMATMTQFSGASEATSNGRRLHERHADDLLGGQRRPDHGRLLERPDRGPRPDRHGDVPQPGRPAARRPERLPVVRGIGRRGGRPARVGRSREDRDRRARDVERRPGAPSSPG